MAAIGRRELMVGEPGWEKRIVVEESPEDATPVALRLEGTGENYEETRWLTATQALALADTLYAAAHEALGTKPPIASYGEMAAEVATAPVSCLPGKISHMTIADWAKRIGPQKIDEIEKMLCQSNEYLDEMSLQADVMAIEDRIRFNFAADLQDAGYDYDED